VRLGATICPVSADTTGYLPFASFSASFPEGEVVIPFLKSRGRADRTNPKNDSPSVNTHEIGPPWPFPSVVF
jgi:hypothetical protein